MHVNQYAGGDDVNFTGSPHDLDG